MVESTVKKIVSHASAQTQHEVLCRSIGTTALACMHAVIPRLQLGWF